jgi:defect-in-organelle-trafficking protein DotC
MKFFSLTLIVFTLVGFMPIANAQYSAIKDDRPQTLDDLIDLPRGDTILDGFSAILPDIKLEAQKEAAYSYGARGGLAWRTWHIRNEMETRARSLDKVFDFRQLLIPAPSGLLIEPPVIGEAMDALLIDNRGMEAAVADRVLNISQNARITSTARTWRSYLEREWGTVDPPPDILRPENKVERVAWEKNIKKGWEMGVNQADEIFQDDLNRLVADYQGMIRYRTLLAQGMVSPPYALQVDRGITGGGNEMRIGDRALSLTQLPQLQTGYKEWQPANR